MRQLAMYFIRMQQACSKAMSIVGGMTRWCRWFTGTLVFGKLGYDTDEKYYNHEPQSVYESTDNKLLWDFKIQTDNKIEHNKPDIVVLDKIEWKCLIIGVPCLFNTLVKEKEKIENYQDLKWELKWIWKLRRVTVVPIIIDALRTALKDKEKWWASEIGVTDHLESLHKACLLGTSRILCKVLDT